MNTYTRTQRQTFHFCHLLICGVLHELLLDMMTMMMMMMMMMRRRRRRRRTVA
jgi:hypothetical protein